MVRLEGGREGFAFASGMQAITSLLLSNPKAHVILSNEVYHGVNEVIKELLQPWGLTFEVVDASNHKVVAAALARASPKNKVLLWIETPSNPRANITDIASLSALARKVITNEEKLCIVVDGTWGTPYLCQPLSLGADVVLHSTTKYIGGHSDVLGGVLVTGHSIGGQAVSPLLRIAHQIGGGVPGSFDTYLALRGLRTLPVRMKQHCASALLLAEYLDDHPLVEHVFYPGLKKHPHHELATVQMNGRYGGMISFLVKAKDNNSSKEALQVVRSVKYFRRATSLGGTESLIEHRASVEGAYGNSPQNLLRVSTGLEDINDLINDIDTALKQSVHVWDS